MAILKVCDQNEIYYEYVAPKPEGKTFVFFNALTGSTATWTDHIGNKIVKEGNGYLAYNFRGQEKSKFDKGLLLDTEVIVNDSVRLINSLNLKNMIFVGLSIGGLYAALALDKGVKSKGLVLINTLRKNNSRLRWINKTMVNVARYGGTSLLMDFNMPVIASPSFLEQMEPNALNPKNYKGLDEDSGIFKLMEGSLTANWDFDWSKIDIPTVIMTGHYDKVFRIPSDIDDICSTMKNIERIEFPECGHLIPMENPIEFADKINQFSDSLS